MTASVQRKTIFAALVAAVVGIPLTFEDGCAPFTIQDPVTGIVRDATPEEVAKEVAKVGEAVKIVPAVTGHFEWLPFADIGIRLAALIFAWFQKQALDKKALTPAPVCST